MAEAARPRATNFRAETALALGTARPRAARERPWTPSAWAVAPLIVGGGLWTLIAGCSESWHSPVELDCSPDDTYDKIETYELGTPSPPWYSYGDNTPGATRTDLDGDGGPFPTQAIEDGGRCGSLRSLLFVSSGYQDYGSGFGDYDPGGLQTLCAPNGTDLTGPIDASGYEGIAFWARSPGASTKTVQLEITDTHSYNSVNDAGMPNACTACMPYVEEAGANGVNVYTTSSVTASANVATGSSVASAEPPPNSCGNNFSYWLITTDDWVFYQIPFSAFTQSAEPNRYPGGFDPSTFFTLIVVVDKEAQLSLWFDDFGFYPKKATGGL